MKKGYRFLEHTADVLFEAEGKNFKEALENTAKAMFETIANNIQAKESFEIEEKAQNLEELVVFCLSDILAESEIKELCLCKFEVLKFEREKEGYILRGRVWGERGKKPKTIVKGVTFHELKIIRSKNYTKIHVLLDV